MDGVGYTGHFMDVGTQLTYMQQRYYDPQIGRFQSVDPMSSDMNNGWNFSRYNYAANNPYKFTDPDGRSIWSAAIKLIVKGGNVAQVTAGVVSDFKTIANPAASTGDKVIAGLSMLSEALPVSGRDAKAVLNAVETASDSKTIYRTGSQSDGALTDASGVSFRDSLSSAADGRQTFKPGDKVFAVDTAKLPAGSAQFDGNPAGHVSVTATPDQIRAAVMQDVNGTPLEGLKRMDDGSYRLPKN
jgi:RHS repeat-associated protein